MHHTARHPKPPPCFPQLLQTSPPAAVNPNHTPSSLQTDLISRYVQFKNYIPLLGGESTLRDVVKEKSFPKQAFSSSTRIYIKMKIKVRTTKKSSPAYTLRLRTLILVLLVIFKALAMKSDAPRLDIASPQTTSNTQTAGNQNTVTVANHYSWSLININTKAPVMPDSCPAKGK
jgi:hypothetical protein